MLTLILAILIQQILPQSDLHKQLEAARAAQPCTVFTCAPTTAQGWADWFNAWLKDHPEFTAPYPITATAMDLAIDNYPHRSKVLHMTLQTFLESYQRILSRYQPGDCAKNTSETTISLMQFSKDPPPTLMFLGAWSLIVGDNLTQDVVKKNCQIIIRP